MNHDPLNAIDNHNIHKDGCTLPSVMSELLDDHSYCNVHSCMILINLIFNLVGMLHASIPLYVYNVILNKRP